MNKTVRSALIIIMLCVATIAIIKFALSSFSVDENSYVSASVDKENVLKRTKSPKVIFAGGSNLALGLNSKLLSTMVERPVVNMGLHAGLGLDFALNQAKLNVRKGDILILSIEHFLSKGNNKLMAQLVSNNPSSYNLLNLTLGDKIRLFFAQLQLDISSTFYKIIGRSRDPYYYRSAFTEAGDVISHYGKPKPSVVSGNINFPLQDYSKEIETLNCFITYCASKGAKSYFIFPAFYKSAYLRNRVVLHDLENQYKAKLHCPIIGTLEQSIYEDNYFFDTVYHLDSLGVQKRTIQVFELLKKNNVIKP
ncbi:hypothetical protein GGR92_002992 [Spirosoma lacussanchae]|uniref:hypothetical protein n=1 Tax=Spirosoma lacussanchae TaxID=1884249 RepID=UPI0011080835|nr:hypothetical protein [Spirosoma lacussanchae]